MIMKTIQQFFSAVDWGELDYLLVDLPPGTGDAQLSLCQTVPLDGGVIVTTPRKLRWASSARASPCFEKVNVPILGIVENMSYFTDPLGRARRDFRPWGRAGGSGAAKCSISWGSARFSWKLGRGAIGEFRQWLRLLNAPEGQAFIKIAETLRRLLP